ncbi:hypothetical protein, partial [Kribbella rubisoli]|uniref:hypothetical protein n=1 Tax=Kribbella rubisoli TaxID=3075929 RepID=UPI001A7ECE25
PGSNSPLKNIDKPEKPVSRQSEKRSFESETTNNWLVIRINFKGIRTQTTNNPTKNPQKDPQQKSSEAHARG